MLKEGVGRGKKDLGRGGGFRFIGFLPNFQNSKTFNFLVSSAQISTNANKVRLRSLYPVIWAHRSHYGGGEVR